MTKSVVRRKQATMWKNAFVSYCKKRRLGLNCVLRSLIRVFLLIDIVHIMILSRIAKDSATSDRLRGNV